LVIREGPEGWHAQACNNKVGDKHSQNVGEDDEGVGGGEESAAVAEEHNKLDAGISESEHEAAELRHACVGGGWGGGRGGEGGLQYRINVPTAVSSFEAALPLPPAL
jgi:hypothetical protein